MKSFFPRFLILTLAGIAFFGVSQVHAAYCWCKTDKAACENHTQTDSIDNPPVPITTQDQCNQYCKARNPSWNAIHFDEAFTDWNAKTVSQGGCLPATSTKPSTPAVPGSPTTLYNPLGPTTLQGLIARVIRSVIGIVGAIALLMFVYGGIIWMTAGGSETQVKKGKSILIQSTIGLLIIFFSYTLVSVFLGGFLGTSTPPTNTQSNP